MYPAGPLALLADRKSDLRLRIAWRREECVLAAQRIAQPVQKIELWRARLGPWLKYLPVGAAFVMARRRGAGRPEGEKKSRWRWLPLAAQLARLAFTYGGRGG